jgi:hypothetical protein
MKKILICSIILNALLVGVGLLLYTTTTIVILPKTKIPDMVCDEITTLYVTSPNPEELLIDAEGVYETTQYMGRDKIPTVLRFKDNKLYISSSDREEYLYNKVTEQEIGRYLSGYKTIIFGLGSDYKKGLVVHSDVAHVDVSRINCTSTTR